MHGCGYCMGRKWRSNQHTSYGIPFSSNDIVECILDMDKKQLSYVHNGTHLGVAFEALPDEVWPAVSLVKCAENFYLSYTGW